MLVQQLSKDAKKAAMFRSRIENVDKWMDLRHLPKNLRQQISKYYAEVGMLGNGCPASKQYPCTSYGTETAMTCMLSFKCSQLHEGAATHISLCFITEESPRMEGYSCICCPLQR